MVTSNTARAGHPSRVIVKDGVAGLSRDSVIMADNLATIHPRYRQVAAEGVSDERTNRPKVSSPRGPESSRSDARYQ